MNNGDNRGDFYIPTRPPGEPAEVAEDGVLGLDFSPATSVNAEEEGGFPDMDLETAVRPAPDTSLNSLDGLEHLMPPAQIEESRSRIEMAEAVSYLRVSTPRQLHTAADLDEDGNSIATQRVEVRRKAKELRTVISREFVEPGQSAQTIAKRAEFKKLLRYIDEHPEVKYVIIYMRSRVFRNFTDAAVTKRELLQKGVRLVSAKEEFGDGYMADAMEAITDVMNEVQVRMNGEDVKVKMQHKVEQGGSVGRAKLGYLNVRKEFGGRLVNTIDVDPERGPLVTFAFEQYASGRYSLSQLRDLVTEHGLTTRPSPSQPAHQVALNTLHSMLRNPYYTGVMRYKDKLYVGRHEPLVTKSIFLRVQEVLDQRSRADSRDSVHFHYLKGLLRCGKCKDEGRGDSRMVYSQAKGNGGTYEYFVCIAKQRRECTMPWVRVEQIEEAVLEVLGGETLTPSAIRDIKDFLVAGIKSLLAEDRDEKDRLQSEYAKLEAQEERLIELAALGTLPVEKIRERIEATTLKRESMREKLERTTERLEYGANTAYAFIDLLATPKELVHLATDGARRDLLTAYFDHLVVRQRPDKRPVLTAERSLPNRAVRTLLGATQAELTPVEGENEEAPHPKVRSSSNNLTSAFAHGSNKSNMAGVPGLEPRTTEPETAVLPITPYPIGFQLSLPTDDYFTRVES